MLLVAQLPLHPPAMIKKMIWFKYWDKKSISISASAIACHKCNVSSTLEHLNVILVLPH